MRKGTKKAANGYFTLEASLLFPLLLGIIAMLFTACFYLYTLCFFHTAAYTAAFRASLPPESTGKDTDAGKELETLWEERILDCGKTEHQVKDSVLWVEVSIAKITEEKKDVLTEIKRKFQLKVKEKSFKRDPVFYIRTIRMTKESGLLKKEKKG